MEIEFQHQEQPLLGWISVAVLGATHLLPTPPPKQHTPRQNERYEDYYQLENEHLRCVL